MQVNFDSESSDISCFKKNIVLDCQKRSFIWNWRYRQLLFLSTTCFLKKLQVARARENVRTWILPLCCLLYFTCHAHSNELVSVTPKLSTTTVPKVFNYDFFSSLILFCIKAFKVRFGICFFFFFNFDFYKNQPALKVWKEEFDIWTYFWTIFDPISFANRIIG